MEDRLHQGSNKWRKGLFEKCDTVGEEDCRECVRSWKFVSPEKWEKFTSSGTMDTEVGVEQDGDDGGTG